jgi:hypothetical protein
MFAGHLGVAYVAQTARRDLPFTVVVAAAFLPDILRLALEPLGLPTEMVTHSVPAVLLLALTLSVTWTLAGGIRPGAVTLALVCLLHWPADVLTGCKPTAPSGPWVGFFMYRHPITDLAVELSLLWIGWLACRRRVGQPGRRVYRWWVPAIACALQLAFLASLYAGAEFFVGRREWTWHPGEGLLTLRRVYDTETLFCRPPEVKELRPSATRVTGIGSELHALHQ